MLAALLGGLLGGAAGVLIWVVVGYFTHYEIGWIAWGIGFLTGFGVRYAAHLRGQDASVAKGVAAAAIAVAAIFAAKFAVFTLVVGGGASETLAKLASEIRIDDESMVASLADEVAAEAIRRGETIAWPPGMSAELASKRSDFPPAIWQQAKTRWNQLGAKQQQDKKRQRVQLAALLSDAARKANFGECFTPWDLLWFGLAVFTAFRIGTGSYREGS